MRKNPFTTTTSLLLVVAGFLLPFWPLCLLGLMLLAVAGRYIVAVVVGLFLDIAFGVPTGVLHLLYVPFTLLALFISLLRYLFSDYFRDEASDTL
jgi:hypothetical protein